MTPPLCLSRQCLECVASDDTHSGGCASDVLTGSAGFVVICADNRDVLPTIPDKGVDHVITDPPYSEWTHRKNRGNPLAGRAALREIEFPAITQDERNGLMSFVARACARWSIVWSDFEGAAAWVESATACGLDHVRCGAWVKVGCAPQMSGDRPGTGAEVACIAHRKGRKRWNGGGHAAVWTHPIAALEGGKEHTTQKPLSLMLELVSLFTDPNDIIIDPFAGSGTTGVAALRLGRRAILIEREPKWADLARERCQAEVEGSTLQARRAGQLPMFGGGT